MARLIETKEEKETAILVGITISDVQDAEEALDELEQLVKTAGALSVGRIMQKREAANRATYVGKGKMEELKELLIEKEATGIVCDDELSPAQMKNLEEFLEVKIMDRTMVILDIFAARANTKEGKLQVELAQLKYRSSKLIGMRSALSRLGGGIGTRGPGEKKLEVDRRVIRERITKLGKELESVELHRKELRKRRNKTEMPVVCIVGYTNAGKSTLLNHLTGAQVMELDQLFATLDPTTRVFRLANGTNIMLTDTVGFIRKLPHHLVQAFRSTLEEARYADVILHVVDASNPQMDQQMHTVYETLRMLEVGDKPIVTAFNKMDKLTEQPVLKDLKAERTIFISAKKNAGLEELKTVIEQLADLR